MHSREGLTVKIGLIDVDGHNFPNIALMKLSTYHKNKGDSVEWYEPLTSGHMDTVYTSKVFTFTEDYEWCINADQVIKGGTGYFYPSGGDPLPEEVEHQYPDYSLYGIKDTAYGFLTRGCPRHCSFCIVGDKEGLVSHKVANLSEFWNGQKYIEIMDPNLLAAKGSNDLLQQLINSKAYVNINQGMDARLLNEENINLVKQIKLKSIHFAWDNIADREKVVPKLELYKKLTNCDMRKTIVYVLTNFNSTLQEDLERVYKIREIGLSPYIMIYDKVKAPKDIKRLARWVNNRFIWYKDLNAKFEDYKQGGFTVINYTFLTGVAVGAALAFGAFVVGYLIALLEAKLERLKYTNSRPRRYK